MIIYLKHKKGGKVMMLGRGGLKGNVKHSVMGFKGLKLMKIRQNALSTHTFSVFISNATCI